MAITVRTVNNVDKDKLANIKEYQSSLESVNNMYYAKKLFRDNSLSNYIITASLINELTQYIQNEEISVLRTCTNWMNIDDKKNEYALAGDCALR